jgi:outer membrane protein OmpA-like peptidoglycan-associated protein
VLLRQEAALEAGLILFDTNSWELSDDQKPRIAELLAPLRNLIQGAEAAHLDLVVELVGHSDSTGTERANAVLSEARARKVMQELVDAGIDVRYLRARGVGATEPVRQEESASDRRYNRSVSFHVEWPQTPK